MTLDLNWESVSEPRTLSGRLFQSLGAICKDVNTTKSPDFCDLKKHDGL